MTDGAITMSLIGPGGKDPREARVTFVDSRENLVDWLECMSEILTIVSDGMDGGILRCDYDESKLSELGVIRRGRYRNDGHYGSVSLALSRFAFHDGLVRGAVELFNSADGVNAIVVFQYEDDDSVEWDEGPSVRGAHEIIVLAKSALIGPFRLS